ncbi:helix-turn-helix domain-containing protein [Pedobacter sp. Hv1]|uniref:helix-turn-helix domain-containing protein n=1 Tax=Pedobacter sp. Hv1 TaxID=1740090 RepID=UPI0006D88E4C|nr:helix-turn-helix domain-containing protein [Pedobacter sp. Hv1]KQB99818.1 transcriptional regulator [Pedobacter sp. Hv1]
MDKEQTQLYRKTKYRLALIGLLCLSVIWVAFGFTSRDDFDMAKQEILLRKIGHEVLLQAGDRTSRVLPVKKIAENEYQIRFEQELTFQADSLVKIISSALSKDKIDHNYIVNVLNCGGNDVIFGYAISKNEKDNIIACSGRVQPKACYVIDVKFQNSGITDLQKGYLVGGLPLLAFVGLIFLRSGKTGKDKSEPHSIEGEGFKIGDTLFDAKKRLLITSTATTTLTAKENKLLLIFAQSPNAIIERSRLQKEIWEDEGVIVGRSLDMFISKLRKKLEIDPSIQLINIHGKGYRLTLA